MDLRQSTIERYRKSALGKCVIIIATKTAQKVEKRWFITTLPNHALKIPNLEIALLVLSRQARINEREEIIDKDRVTHDFYFPVIASETSINEQMKRDKFAETHYGNMHKKLINSIRNMQVNYSTTGILIIKYDFKRAYQRQHLSAQSEIHSATQINWKGTF